ncbi:MKI67 FHA domain-interacting nucleolar phosphoprotein [Cyanidiococcus yangmingshanensis]|uniref:MKI67 FHA domain-interacting nucleolar phosphoprotein n=1 Tax=Cyanidiococcus yangmingshanensis TaxID=2690220 RepID=A0A7J7IGH1_9RHOD|nr:MKI67 FHA domain-interacting nucleolar phosphoprotein [Cyanidiococcus yangmingshanensis]
MRTKKGSEQRRGGVLYIGHVPHGFYEQEMKRFFSQFGQVIQVRLSRSKRTGRSRGYAFVHFAEAAVARIVADAMDGYLMFGKRLVVRQVPLEKIHRAVFREAKPLCALEQSRQLERERFLRGQARADRSRSDQRRRRKVQRRLASIGAPYSAADIWCNTAVLTEHDTFGRSGSSEPGVSYSRRHRTGLRT